jgi:Flp pilus assembly pilin Flp
MRTTKVATRPNNMLKGRRPKLQFGQGMIEYIVIGALIAIAAIAVYSAWGKTTRDQTAGLARELAGKTADMAKVQDAANAAAGRANDPQKEGMASYNFANDQK